MKTNIYIDGLNFYYGATKDTPYKWVNLKGLIQDTLGETNEIQKIKLFAAKIKPTKQDPTAHERQNAYFRALRKTIPEIEFHYGHFLEHNKMMPLSDEDAKPRFVEVIKREEKGSDVNLALHFLNDAWLNEYDCGVIVSNDSDLAESIALVRKQTNKKIGVISPFSTISKELSQHSHFTRKIRRTALAANQLPDNILDTKIRKPSSW